MLEIFKAQTDYLAFLVGLCFSFLFLICMSLARHRQSHPVFFWLGLFSLSQWGWHWLSMLSSSWENLVLQDFIAIICVIMALSFLGACGISIIVPPAGRRLVNSILMLMLTTAWFGSKFGQFSFFGAVFLVVGFGCSLMAGWALLLFARGKHSIFLSLAALSLMGYGLTLPLTLPIDQFLLIKTIHDLARVIFNPISLYPLQVLASFLTTLSMWFYYQDEVWRRSAREHLSGIQSLMYSSYFILAICLILAIGGVSTGLFGQNLEADMRRELASRARTLAAAISQGAIQPLTGSNADLGAPHYENLKRLLMAIRTANKDCRFIYLLGFKNQDVIFLVDSEPLDSQDYSPPGQVYKEASPTLKSMAVAPRAFVEGPEPDRWGTWITAFDVIKDPSSGEFLALVGLDIDARDWQRKIALHKLLPINITLLMIILLTGFYLSQQRLLASTQHLAESEERYRSLVEGTPNGVCLFDREGRCLAINRNGLAMLGAREQEISGRLFQDYWSQEQQPRLAEAFAQVRAGRLVSFEGGFSPSQGGARFWHVVLNPIKGKNDSLLGSVGILADITEQKQAEEELRASRALLQSLLDSIPDLLMVIDRDYRIVYSNNQGRCSIRPHEESSCPRCYQRLHSQDAPCQDCPAQIVFTTGRTVEQEKINPDDGRINEVRIFPIFSVAGQVTMVIEHVRDITERKQVEEALRTRQAKLDGIFRAAPVGIGLLVNRVFKEVNDQVCIMTGYAREEILEKSARFLYPSQEEFELVGREKYRQIAEQGKGTIETHWLTRDGILIDVMLSSAPLFEADNPQEILFTAMNITERKKLEAARYTIDKMESLGIMAGGIAHDFNNVLMAILGNISLVGLAATPNEIQERLGDAEQGCRQAMLLAKQLLTFAKGGAPVKKPDDLRLIVQEAARLALSGSKSKTTFAFPEDLWNVDVDRGQMHQVFTNLLINADQAMPLGGQIHIQAGNYTVKGTASTTLIRGDYVLVTISDQGVGIAPDQLDKIYDPYYSTKQKGSGLGLATVYSIVKQHGGLITCESKLGRGATFHLYLPALEQSEKIKKLGGKKLFSGHGRILVLEDDATVRNVMGRMLTKLGYDPVFAPEGQEALDLFDQARTNWQPFDLVILDLTIPGGKGGLETLQGLLALEPRTKAIVSSGYADDPVLANFHEFGFCGVITKPYRIAELSEIIHKVRLAP
jgi:PAS domain S-box-containing protein